MSVGYLPDGQKVEIFKTLDCGFLVKEIIQWNDEDEECEDVSDKVIFVEKCFDKPPRGSYDREVERMKEEINKLSEELGSLQYELRTAKQEKTNWERMIFNKSELFDAKRITCFHENDIEPFDLCTDKAHRLKISVTFELNENKIRSHCYRYTYDDWSTSRYFDEKYGFLINKTDEEILAMAIDRASKIGAEKIGDWQLKRVDDKFLTPELINHKNMIIQRDNKREIEEVKSNIAKEQKKLEELTANK